MKRNYDEFVFFVGYAMPSILYSTAVVNRGLIGPNGENVVQFRTLSGATGLSDDMQNHPPSAYIHGTENYDGLRRVFDFRSNRYLDIIAPYVAETPPSGTTFGPGFKSQDPHEFGGFSVHVSDYIDASEDLEIIIRSAKGSYHDSLIYSQDMYDVLDINEMFDKPIPLMSNDRIEFSMSSVHGQDITVKLYVRKV